MKAAVCFLLTLLSCPYSTLTGSPGHRSQSLATRTLPEPVEFVLDVNSAISDVMNGAPSPFDFMADFRDIMGVRDEVEKVFPVKTGYVHALLKGNRRLPVTVNVDIPPSSFNFSFSTVEHLMAPDERLSSRFPTPRSLHGDRPEIEEVFVNPRMIKNFDAVYDQPDTRELANRIILLSKALLKFLRSLPLLGKPEPGEPTVAILLSAIPVTIFAGEDPITFVIPDSKMSFAADV